MEIWKDIPEYEGYYQISNLGRVKSLARKRKNNPNAYYETKDIILKPYAKNKRYYGIYLMKNNTKRYFLIHRLVAEIFVPNPSKKVQVNHIDGNKENNCASNLEWVTASENIIHAYKNNLRKAPQPWKNKKGKMCPNSKAIIQYNLENNKIREWDSVMDASRELKINFSNIGAVCRGERNTAGGFKWKYK